MPALPMGLFAMPAMLRLMKSEMETRGAEVRAAQRLAAAGVAGGRPDGHLAGRLGRHRNRLRHQWRRAAGLDVHPARRLPHDAGADPDLCADLHRPDPGRRPDQRLAGPPRASRLMSTVLSSSLPAAPRGDRLARAGRRFGLIVLALLVLAGVSHLIKCIGFLMGRCRDPREREGAKSAEEELAEEIAREAQAREAAAVRDLANKGR
ncbi:hypothetical protein G6F57_019474 [Rhizopus arrhizus]|nr:hypothetical protein G6F57_019474 [Rhizopus arrhizus]